MPAILLTIAIPTFNRATLLDKCLGAMFLQITEDNKEQVEFIISDNDSNDNTIEIVDKYINKGLQIKYSKNPKNVGPDRNIASCFLKANGKYVWIFSDDDFILPGYLKFIIDLLAKNDLGNIYLNGHWYKKEFDYTEEKPLSIDVTKYSQPIEFIEKVNYWSTFLTGNIVNKSLFRNFDDIPKYYESCLVQLVWTLPIIFGGKDNVVINNKIVACLADNTGGYKLIKVFGKNYNDILGKMVDRKIMPEAAKKIIKKHLLTNFFPLFLNVSNADFEKENPLKILIPVYWNYLKFWTSIFPGLIKRQLV